MKKITRKNRACLFHDTNQGDEIETKYMCTIYGMFINAKYNGVIKDFTEDEIKAIAKKQAGKGEFGYEWGAYVKHSNKAVLEYFDSIGVEYTCLSTTDDSEVLEWIENGYAVATGIRVNRTFALDRKDGKLDLSDYSKYKGEGGHLTNFIKWTCRGKFDCSDNGKEMCLDSYFAKNSTYECDIKKVLAHLDQNTKYIIF